MWVPLYIEAPGTPDATWKPLLQVSLYMKDTTKAQPLATKAAISGHQRAVVRHNWACGMGRAKMKFSISLSG